MTGAEFLAALAEGRAELVEERRITGPVILRGGELTFPVRALYTLFEGEVDFADTVFHGGIDFSGCTFATTLRLRNVRVDGDLILHDVQVKNLSSLWGVRLPDLYACDLGGAEIAGDVTITRSVIAGAFVAANITIGGELVIAGTEIDGGTNISNAIITGDVRLGSWASSPTEDSDTRVGFFNNGLQATNMRVKGQFRLHGAQVDGDVMLWGGVFKSSVFAGPMVVAQSKLQTDGTRRTTKELLYSMVNGELNLAATRVSGHLQLNSLRVAGDLSMISLTCSAVQLLPHREPESHGPPCEVARLLMSGARIAGDVRLSMLRVTGRPWLAASSRGVLLNNSTVGGNLTFWSHRAFATEDEVMIPAARDAFGAGAVISGDLEIRGTVVSGECDLTNAWVSGTIRLNDSHVRGDIGFRSRASLLGLPILDAGGRELLLKNASAHLRARTTSLDLTMVRCDNDIDLTGLDLDISGASAADLRAGSIAARSVYAASEIQLHALGTVGRERIEDSTGVPGAADFEGMHCRRFRVSTRDFEVDHPTEADIPIRGLRLAGARVTELVVESSRRKSGFWERLLGQSDVRFPAPLDLRDLSVDVWSIGAPASAAQFSALLECDPVFRRDTFTRIEQNLRNVGHDAAATEIYKEMCRREREMERRASLRWPYGLWRGPLMLLGELFLYLPFSRLMGFGTAPLRLLFVITLLWAVMIPAYYVPANFQESLSLRLARGHRDEPSSPPPSEWTGVTPLFASARYHLPIVGLSAHDEWELSGRPETCWSARGLPNVAASSPACELEIPLSPEDLGVLVTLINWALWPLVLTFTIRKLLR